jgi:hypothetical protein
MGRGEWCVFCAGAEAPAYSHPSPRDDKMCNPLLNHAKIRLARRRNKHYLIMAIGGMNIKKLRGRAQFSPGDSHEKQIWRAG